jgi:hypothetical protein
MGRQMLYLAHALRNKKAATAAAHSPPGPAHAAASASVPPPPAPDSPPPDAASSSFNEFADGERANDFAELIEKNPLLFIFASYLDYFALDVKQTKSGGVISLIPLFFDPKYKTHVVVVQKLFFCVSLLFCFCFLSAMVSGMNEIPIAFFPPARTSEQLQIKLYDFNVYMMYVYEMISHGFKGEKVRAPFFSLAVIWGRLLSDRSDLRILTRRWVSSRTSRVWSSGCLVGLLRMSLLKAICGC